MGVFISIEGGDGAGKGTQARLLTQGLQEAGAEVKLEAFPRYSGPLGGIIGAYLNGDYGTSNHPVLASLAYTFDRSLVTDEIRHYQQLSNGVYLADRFDDSNDGHQGAKLATKEERLALFEHLKNFEHGTIGVPEPDKTILLPVPPALAQENIDKKNARSYTNLTRDMHEADTEHLQNAYDSFMLLAEQNPDRIIVIDPVEADRKTMRPMEEIQTDIRRALLPILTERLELQRPIET